MSMLYAFCYRNGQIEFNRHLPQSSILIGKGPEKQLRWAVMMLARQSHPSKPGRKDCVPLVPGVPEAATDKDALDAMIRFRQKVRVRMNPVTWAMEKAINIKYERPDAIAVAIFKNDLASAVTLAAGGCITLEQLLEAVLHLSLRIKTEDAQSVLKKWGKR